MGKEILLLGKIEEICNLNIKDYYKIILIKKLIDNWREE